MATPEKRRDEHGDTFMQADTTACCIKAYYHCAKCLEELPADESPESYARYGVGSTPWGWQLWCNRHQCNVINVDYEGHSHRADVRAHDSGATGTTEQ